MATVYLAEDLRHRRRVALKILRPELAAIIGAERFLHEITTTANLQHPHILPLHDSGSVDGTVFYVMPFVDGESLRTRLVRERQLPIEEALRIAREVAAALDYAHRHGVIHRDIKPENILLHDGTALVCDFGIALAASTAGASRMTETGMSLGTPQYMSPEQAAGERNIDARTDVYALGCVVYEMLLGEAPFTGPSAQSIIARVLNEEPRSIRTLRKTVPPHVEAAVLIALAKLPADRFHSTVEFVEALSRPGIVRVAPAGTRTVPDLGQPDWSRRLGRLAPWSLALLTTMFAVWSLLRTRPAPFNPVVRFGLTPPSSVRVIDVGGYPVTISPDGARLAYIGAARQPSRPRQLYLWNLDQSAPTALAGTENALFPFFSPDGQWIGFAAGGQLRRVPIQGGGAITISDAGTEPGVFRGATWTTRGEILFATSLGLRRVPAQGGTVQSVKLEPDSNWIALWPSALPGGKEVLVALLDRNGRSLPELAVVALESGHVTLLHQSGSYPRFVRTGHIAVTMLDGSMVAMPFDWRRRRITGPPTVIEEGLSVSVSGTAKSDVAGNGTLVYLVSPTTEQRQLLRVDRHGTARPLDAPPRDYSGPRISPDGNRVAVTIGPTPNAPLDIWVYDLQRSTLSRITSDSASLHPAWSADGRRIYHRRSINPFTATATTVDRSAPPESLYATRWDLWEVIPTRSADTIITRELRSLATDRDIMLVPLRGAGPEVPLAGGPGTQAEPALSPDGGWLAYSSDESGSMEVYVRPFPGAGARYQVSSGGGMSPRWNPRGGELFFISRDSLVSVTVRANHRTLAYDRDKALFPVHFSTLSFHANYDVAPDGSWFVFVNAVDPPALSSFRLVLNWFDQPSLRRP